MCSKLPLAQIEACTEKPHLNNHTEEFYIYHRFQYSLLDNRLIVHSSQPKREHIGATLLDTDAFQFSTSD